MMSTLFNWQLPLGSVLEKAHEAIKAEVRSEPDSYVRDADPEQWAQHLAEKHATRPPVLVKEQQEVEDLGEREVDATGMPGVTFSTSEWGRRIFRPGREFRLVMPFDGDAELLKYGCQGSREFPRSDHENSPPLFASPRAGRIAAIASR